MPSAAATAGRAQRAPWPRLSTLAGEVGGAEVHGEALVEGVTEDSHAVVPGMLFCAVRGARVDGHTCAERAVERGAAALLVERWLDLDVPQLRVPNTRAALGPVAAAVYGRPSAALRTVGVTGTNGKTTVTWALAEAFAAAGWAPGLIGTIETRVVDRRQRAALTTPQPSELQATLATMAAEGVEALAMEVSSQALDQCRVDGICFDVAVFLGMAPEHLDYHGTMAHYYASKAALFDPARATLGVVRVDDEWGRRLAHQAAIPVTTFGTSPEAQVRVEEVSTGLWGTRCRLRGGPDGTVELASPLIGAYNATNLAATYLAARLLGVGRDEAVAGIGACEPVPGRFQPVDRGQPFLVVVDFAHTPDAMAVAVDTARSLVAPGGRVHVVFGCAGERDRLKRPTMGRAAARADR
ncbi:MAG TPA: UDP-N-acetylmuramoyl-L-alanyl-D-glutamate--2,6-diaminopimelate ligase, partial [Acidimicrobiales bacterium]|nr:UDP-N-acetylmuramoyl-L-alanyl-D-glutamate--2,6-diaminopimelate ligase [Acidimicrobiales bacterium]